MACGVPRRAPGERPPPGALSREQKAALAKELTEACVRVLGGKPDGVDVIFRDVARHDWATGGRLWSEPAPPTEGS